MAKAKQTAIELERLTKVFKKNKGKTTAVDNVSLTIPKGIIFGLLGPNGAGKTTTIAMICTLLRPTKGTVRIFGNDVNKDLSAARANLGLVFQETTLDINLSGYDNLNFQAMIYKVPHRQKKIAEVLKLVGLEKVKEDEVKSYSGGMKRRLEIARALINDPQIILLDEPTLGLDAASRREMWKYIQDLVQQKQLTVLLTTHYLEEAERLCERIAIMDAGKIVAEGSPRELIHAAAKDVITLSLKKQDEKLVTALKKEKLVREVHTKDDQILLHVDDASTAALSVLQKVPKEQLVRIEIKQPTLEDAYLHYTGKQFSEADEVKKK